MRIAFSLVVACLLASCGPDVPGRVASDKVVEGAANPGATWPLLLQHCLRSSKCDPASDFGKGEEQASGLAGSVAWFAETEKRVSEGAQDYGAAFALTVFGNNGQSGPAGRTLTVDERPDTLNGTRARRSSLVIEYRTPGGGAPEPYSLWFTSAWLVIPGAAIDEAKVEIAGKAGVVLSEAAGAMAAEEGGRKTTPKGIDPVTFMFPRNIRDDRVDALLAALMAGETLSLKLYAPDGRLLLADALYAIGYEGALKQATDSLADPEIANSIAARCERFMAQPDSFWKIADVTPALLVCDPRTPEQRR
ncbi:MAG: hypothetical protein Q8R82_15150 [Hyphomonadaceae bacterium]|nr:hypothetical protein [Hyphomonadaceae bacterium]